MSAWIVFSMMGIYPVVPADPIYTLTTPVFDKVTIHLNSDYYKKDKLEIEKEGRNEGNIKEVILNGNKHKGYFISHKDLVEGENLKFLMD